MQDLAVEIKKQKAFSCACSVQKDWRKAVQEIADEARKGLNGRPCDLAVFFVTEFYKALDPSALATRLADHLPSGKLIGCNASGVIAKNSEIEMEPAMGLLAMHLPGVKLTSFALSPEQTASLKTKPELVAVLDIYPTENPHFLLLADPMSTDIDNLLRLFNDAYPGSPVIGGLASGAAVGQKSWLALDGDIEPGGAVGVALSGPIEFETIVSQGCRPIGEPLIITKAEQHILYELAGRQAVTVLRDMIAQLQPEDRELARHSLFVGLAMNEYKPSFKRGDFLIRNILGYDAASGALMIGANLKMGQTLQFQLRDAKASAEDLRAMLESRSESSRQAQGALLFSCCGRGRGLYGKPHHDVRMIQSVVGANDPLPIAGFFANGEIGPVGGMNYIHGYTSSLVLMK
jgi:small ligand-binding sensory domain FIST